MNKTIICVCIFFAIVAAIDAARLTTNPCKNVKCPGRQQCVWHRTSGGMLTKCVKMPKAGFCDASEVVSPDIQLDRRATVGCRDDDDCSGATMKCCPNGRGGFSCKPAIFD
ncbi:uncharacterized protein LOC141913119 [Tubulanus polymorphus]|uniref:uncharacterized protein LOC141913119 n=1 Tax=Tubulanus polymorphus TaxID=672921 RepID=UPI003DA29DAF